MIRKNEQGFVLLVVLSILAITTSVLYMVFERHFEHIQRVRYISQVEQAKIFGQVSLTQALTQLNQKKNEHEVDNTEETDSTELSHSPPPFIFENETFNLTLEGQFIDLGNRINLNLLSHVPAEKQPQTTDTPNETGTDDIPKKSTSPSVFNKQQALALHTKLQTYFDEIDFPDHALADLVDWIDSNDEPYQAFNGIRGHEKRDYLSLGKKYEPRNHFLTDLQELALLYQWPTNAPEQLSSAFFANNWCPNQKLNINTATLESLRIVFPQESDRNFEDFIAAREEKAFQTLNALTLYFGDVQPVLPLLDIKSTCYRVQIDIKSDNGFHLQQHAIAIKQKKGYNIVQRWWQD